MERIIADEWDSNVGDKILPLFGPSVLRVRVITPTPITLVGTRSGDAEQITLGYMPEGYSTRQVGVSGFDFVTFNPENDTVSWSIDQNVIETFEAQQARAEAE